MYKRISVMLVLLIVLSLSLTACSSGEVAEDTGETSTKIEAPIFPDAIPDSGKYKAGLDKATEEFRALSPDFNVESNIYIIPSVTSDDVYNFYNDAFKEPLGEGTKSQTEGGNIKFQWTTENQEVTVYHLPDPTGAENVLIVLNAWK